MKNIMKKHIVLVLALVIMQLFIAPTLIFSQKLDNLGALTETLGQVLQKFAVANGAATLAATDISSGYIGGWPHVSIENGTAQAIANVNPTLDVAKKGTSASSSDFASLFEDGKKIPGVGISNLTTIRVGGIYLRKLQLSIPIETSLSIGIIPKNIPIVSAMIKPFNVYNIYVQGFSIGGGFRTPIYQEQRLIPGVSLGLFYYYAGIETGMTIPFSKLLEDGVKGGKSESPIKLTIPDADAIIKINSHTISMKIHAQKHILFIEPYIGVEPSLIIASSEVAIDGIKVKIEDNSGKEIDFDNNINTFKIPDELKFAEDGFKLKTTSVSFASRFYAGGALRIWNFYFSNGFGYDPFNQSLTSNIKGRYTF